jgi:hypothetical protein
MAQHRMGLCQGVRTAAFPPLFGTLLPIPRPSRKAPDGQVYHALNRSVGMMHRLREDADFESFQHDVIEALRRDPIRILSYCVSSNHWHFVV